MILDQEKEAVGMGKRIAAGLIDIIFYIIVFSFLSIIFTGQVDNLPNSVAWIPICLYVVVFHYYLNWTPGMKIMGYRFVDSQGKLKLSGWKMVARWLVAFILRFSTIFGLIALFTFKSESGFYWDRWFGVRVINNK